MTTPEQRAEWRERAQTDVDWYPGSRTEWQSKFLMILDELEREEKIMCKFPDGPEAHENPLLAQKRAEVLEEKLMRIGQELVNEQLQVLKLQELVEKLRQALQMQTERHHEWMRMASERYGITCLKKGPYLPVGDTDWMCVVHDVELVRVSGDISKSARRDELKCPVGEAAEIERVRSGGKIE